MPTSAKRSVRNLVIVFGDQLDAGSAAFDGFDPEADAVAMMEVHEEASHVPQHKLRLALFFSAMRHFRDALRQDGRTVHYTELEDADNTGSLAGEIERRAKALRPDRLIVLQPGDWRVEQAARNTAKSLDLPHSVRDDRHFLCSAGTFEALAQGRRSLLMETFYRAMRREHRILMDGDKPVGGQWNLDRENRGSFGKDGAGEIPPPLGFAPDRTTREVLDMVERRFPDAPGRLDSFDTPVTADQAQSALDDFLEHRLENFGRYQDAMAVGQPFLYHARLSAALNLHLLDPRAAIEGAVAAYQDGRAPLNSVEGFVRQILGWREYIRGVYWREMPGYADRNALQADLPMPAFFWTGETEMACIRHSVGQLIDHAYAHHIQRLMVLGLFAMLLGVRPYEVHRWHMSMYADAIDWVSLPNVLGMSQYGDGGIVGSKPYAASGNYIDKMSDYCKGCRFNPRKATGDDACPVTTLYWDFLDRNRDRIRGQRHMGYQIANLDRKEAAERQEIRRRSERLKASCTAKTYL